MVEFRYRVLSQIKYLLTISLYLITIMGSIFYLTSVSIILSILLANLLLVIVIMSSDIYSHIVFNEEGLSIKYLHGRTKYILLKHISYIEIDQKNKTIAIIHLKSHSTITVKLTKLKETSLFLELIQIAGISIYKDQDQTLSFNTKDLFFYKIMDALKL